jgi:hypothetical protein
MNYTRKSFILIRISDSSIRLVQIASPEIYEAINDIYYMFEHILKEPLKYFASVFSSLSLYGFINYLMTVLSSSS